MVSGALFEQRLKFQLAHTIALGLFDEESLHEPVLEGYTGDRAETRRLIKIHLANYFAGALLLPYPEFYREVTRTRYDVELLAQRGDGEIAIVGPSTPLTPRLHAYGIDLLAGLIVEDVEAAARGVAEGGAVGSLKPHARMVTLTAS